MESPKLQKKKTHLKHHFFFLFFLNLILKLGGFGGGSTHGFCSAFLFYISRAAVVLNVIMELLCIYSFVQSQFSHLDSFS